MKTYWDLTEKERAALDPEDVERFIDAELMTKGVLRAPPLDLLPEPTIPEPEAEVFALRQSFQKLDVAFPTAEAAHAALKLGMMRLTSVYLGSVSYPVVEPAACEVIAEKMHPKAQTDTFRREFEKAGEIRTENQRRVRARDEQTRLEMDALKGLWSDWHACCAKAVEMRRVSDTFADYQRIAGDPKIASRFLGKVFPRDVLTEANEWFGVGQDFLASEIPEEAPPPVAAYESAAEAF